MTTQPPGKGSGLMSKKVAGVPVLYLAAAFVVVLVVFAWRMKPTGGTVTPDPATTDPTTGDGTVYPTLPDQGVVGSTTPMPAVALDNNAIDTNDAWLKAGVALLTRNGISPGQAQQALQLYLSGADLTYAQGEMRDTVIRQYGLPPFPGDIGNTAPKPVTTVNKPPVVKPPVAKPPSVVPAPPRYPGTIIQSGSRGTYVTIVQKRVGVKADGVFGPATKAAVVSFQRAHHLTADGQVGPITWRAMFG